MSDHNDTTSIEYRTIARYVGYRFGSDGSVWSSWRKIHLSFKQGTRGDSNGPWRHLNCALNATGYLQVGLNNAVTVRQDNCLVHRMILEAFVGPCPKGSECRHLDGNRANNALRNLSWGTSLENAGDRTRHGSSGRLKEAQILEIRRQAALGKTQAAIAAEFGVCKNLVGLIVRREIWKQF